MKRFFVSIFSALALVLPSFATGSFSLAYTESAVYTDNYINSTLGELSVVLVNSTSDSSALVFVDEYTDSLYQCSWYSFKESADDLTPISDGVKTKDSISTLSRFNLDCGYAVEYLDNEGKSHKNYIWLTKNHPISKISWNKDSTFCDRLPLLIEPVMTYTPIVGMPTVIKRKLDVAYGTYELSNDELVVSQQDLSLNGDSVLYIYSVPTANTPFHVTDVNFGTHFVTDTFYTTAVKCFPKITTSEKAINELDNKEVSMYFDGGSSFRQSAPLYLDFTSNMTPAVTSFEWQFANDSSFAGAISYSQASLRDIPEKLFEKAGNYWVKLIVRNDRGDCSYETVAKFKIESSELYIPNAFTPGGGNANDVFYVSYKSIAEYDCRIYNQWGRKVFDSQDITEGWDGTDNGDKLPTGVYFYVIKAKGVDGKNYNKKGTINLFREAK